LSLLLPITQNDQLPEHPSGYVYSDPQIHNANARGVTPHVFELASKYHNFTGHLLPALMDINWHSIRKETFKVQDAFGKVDIPQIYFELYDNYFLDTFNTFVYSSIEITQTKIQIFISPMDGYSLLEVLLLVFSLETWILVGILLLIIWLFVYLTNLFFKRNQSLNASNVIVTSTWSPIGIILGISQRRLSRHKMSRLILMTFVVLCLILRISFQSKMFGYTANKPLRPSLKTIDDLIENGYKFYMLDQSMYSTGDLYTNKFTEKSKHQ
jgi:hypothetical protein